MRAVPSARHRHEEYTQRRAAAMCKPRTDDSRECAVVALRGGPPHDVVRSVPWHAPRCTVMWGWNYVRDDAAARCAVSGVRCSGAPRRPRSGAAGARGGRSPSPPRAAADRAGRWRARSALPCWSASSRRPWRGTRALSATILSTFAHPLGYGTLTVRGPVKSDSRARHER